MMASIEVYTAAMLVSGIVSVICRLHKMQPGKTQPVVVAQHMAMGMGLAAALVLGAPLAKAALATAIVLYLLAGAARWRYAAPVGTATRPGELDELPPHAAGHVAGGRAAQQLRPPQAPPRL